MRHADDPRADAFGDPRARDEVADLRVHLTRSPAVDLQDRARPRLEIQSGLSCEISYSHSTGDHVPMSVGSRKFGEEIELVGWRGSVAPGHLARGGTSDGVFGPAPFGERRRDD